MKKYGGKILTELAAIKKGNFVIRFSSIAIILLMVGVSLIAPLMQTIMVGVSLVTPLMQTIMVRYEESITPERQAVLVNTNNLQDEMRGDRDNEAPQLFKVSETERNDGEALSMSDNNLVDTRNARR